MSMWINVQSTLHVIFKMAFNDDDCHYYAKDNNILKLLISHPPFISQNENVFAQAWIFIFPSQNICLNA